MEDEIRPPEGLTNRSSSQHKPIETQIFNALSTLVKKIQSSSVKDPNALEKELLVGSLLQLQGKYHEALELYEKLLNLGLSQSFNKGLQIVDYMFQVYQIIGKESEGIQFIERFLIEHPRESVEAHEGLAILYSYLGIFYLSSDLYSKAVKAYEASFRYWGLYDQKSETKIEMLEKMIDACEKAGLSAEYYRNHMHQYLENIKVLNVSQQKMFENALFRHIFNFWLVRNEDDICLLHYPPTNLVDSNLFSAYLSIVDVMGQNEMKAGTLNAIDFNNWKLIWFRNSEYNFHLFAQVNRNTIQSEIMDKLFKIMYRFNQEFGELIPLTTTSLTVFKKFEVIIRKQRLFEDDGKDTELSVQNWLLEAKNALNEIPENINDARICLDAAAELLEKLQNSNMVIKNLHGIHDYWTTIEKMRTQIQKEENN